MAGIAPKLPLRLNPNDGLGLTKTLKETIKQNLKMLVLTCPGERLMIPDYGVGLRNYLFEQNIASTRTRLADKINEQVSIYMPFIDIVDVLFGTSEVNPQILEVKIRYYIPNSSRIESLDIDVDSNAGY
jgi:phage baseplate assembly protein W